MSVVTLCMLDVFGDLTRPHSISTAYVNEFEHQLQALKEERSNNAAFAAYLRTHCPAGDVSSLLITPVQRVPRYLMLLKSLCKHCDDSTLAKAMAAVGSVAVLIDQRAKDAEAHSAVLVVADILVGFNESLCLPGRKLLSQSLVFIKRNEKDWKERTIFLFNDVLLWCQSVESAEERKVLFQVISFMLCAVVCCVRLFCVIVSVHCEFWVSLHALLFRRSTMHATCNVST